MRGDCPVACGKWGPNASGEATSRRGLAVGEKGPHLNSQSDSSLLTACCRAIVRTRVPFQFTTPKKGYLESTVSSRIVYHWRTDHKVCPPFVYMYISLLVHSILNVRASFCAAE